MNVKNILVFCGSQVGENPIYAETAENLGIALAKRQLNLVYGGGSTGLMGILANSTLAHGGHVSGVIPHFIYKNGFGHDSLQVLHKVESMLERKAIMEELCDAIITLPGGFGSLDELFEILASAHLKLHTKPIGLLNINGFYDFLLNQLNLMVREGFLKKDSMNLLVVSNNIDDLLLKVLSPR